MEQPVLLHVLVIIILIQLIKNAKNVIQHAKNVLARVVLNAHLVSHNVSIIKILVLLPVQVIIMEIQVFATFAIQLAKIALEL